MRKVFILLFYTLCISLNISAQVTDAPDRTEGKGPFKRLIIRGVTLINSTGAPPYGPVDIVIEGNKIAEVRSVGYPGVAIAEKSRPTVNPGDEVLECEGMYALPGFIDMHGHIGGKSQGTPSEYVFKLWLGHGITTVRDPGSGNGLDWNLRHKKRSEKNEITAPRIYCYTTFGQGWDKPIATAEEGVAWVKENAAKGADGIKFFGAPPAIFAPALTENKKLGLRSACHHAQLEVARMNVVASAKAGLTSMEHWYGLPEALFEDKTIQDYPVDYNYNNEQHRFEEAGKLWKQATQPGSAKWNQVMDQLLALDFTLDPTFNIYEANRDLMRARNAEWHKDYTLPSLWKFYAPSRISHGSYWFEWGTEQEVAWRQNYQLWMRFVNEYKNRGGRVTAGSDSGFIYQLYGFGYVRELELLREAGFHPLEVIRAATLKGAEALGADKEIGSIEVNKKADILIMKKNPLSNLKYLYGTGTLVLNEKNEEEMAGGIDYTIKDGIVYDARKLLEDVRNIVKKAREE